MSTANFVERAIAGLKPDVALMASIFYTQIHDFTPRLMKSLGFPKLILPTHWDNSAVLGAHADHGREVAPEVADLSPDADRDRTLERGDRLDGDGRAGAQADAAQVLDRSYLVAHDPADARLDARAEFQQRFVAQPRPARVAVGDRLAVRVGLGVAEERIETLLELGVDARFQRQSAPVDVANVEAQHAVEEGLE
jgi:hypothetical protein